VLGKNLKFISINLKALKAFRYQRSATPAGLEVQGTRLRVKGKNDNCSRFTVHGIKAFS